TRVPLPGGWLAFYFPCCLALSMRECRLQYRERDLVVQVHAAPGRDEASIDRADQPGRRQPVELGVEAERPRDPFGCAQPEHQGLRPRFARVQLLPIGFGSRSGRDVLARAGDVPRAPGTRAVRGVRVRAGAGAVDGPAAPIGEVVPRLETRPRP